MQRQRQTLRTNLNKQLGKYNNKKTKKKIKNWTAQEREKLKENFHSPADLFCIADFNYAWEFHLPSPFPIATLCTRTHQLPSSTGSCHSKGKDGSYFFDCVCVCVCVCVCKVRDKRRVTFLKEKGKQERVFYTLLLSRESSFLLRREACMYVCMCVCTQV